MKCPTHLAPIGWVLFAISLSACTATPIKPGGFQGEYEKPADIVKKAAVDALTVNGFEISQSDDTYVEGHRPRTWGFFCTPGGEGAGVWFEPTSPSHTMVRINSEKSSFGYACQKEWAGPILSEMDKRLTGK